MGWPKKWTDLSPIDKGDFDAWIEGFAGQEVRDMRDSFQSPKDAERQDSGCEAVSCPATLQQGLREQQKGCEAGNAFVAGAEIQEIEVRMLRSSEKIGSASLRPRSNQQRPSEPTNAMQSMPRLLARFGKEAWQDGSWENAVPRVAQAVASRVDRLKAIGNGQVPAVVRLAWNILTD